jgi:hypothetical protein
MVEIMADAIFDASVGPVAARYFAHVLVLLERQTRGVNSKRAVIRTNAIASTLVPRNTAAGINAQNFIVLSCKLLSSSKTGGE